MSPFVVGVLAGYGIAIPVGAIAILIIQVAMQRGFRFGFAAGSGAATADLTYATLAAFGGQALALALEPWAPVLRIASALLLLFIGGMGMWKLKRPKGPPVKRVTPERGVVPTYIQFLGLTLLNPLTVAYFAALVLGGSTGETTSLDSRALFIAGAALASWSWQSLLAVIGAVARRRLSPRFQMLTSAIGNFVVIALGVQIIVNWL